MVLLFLKKLFIFSVFCSLAYVLTCLIVPQVWISKNQTGMFGFSLTRFRELQTLGQDSTDIVFVGASNCYRTFDNRLYAQQGLRTFTLGTTSQTPLNSYFLLKEYIDKLKPKSVVLELSPGALQLQDGQESFLNIAVNHPITDNIIQMGVSNKKLNCFNTLVSEVVKRKFKPLTMFSEQTPTTKYIEGGYVEDTSCFLNQLDVNPFECNINQMQVEYLHKIVSLLKNKNVNIAAVVQPYPSLYYKRAKNFNDYIDWVSNFCTTNHIDFLTTNTLKLDDKDDFADILHLNNNGSQKFNKQLIEKRFLSSVLNW